ncbi:hypothetical protein ABW21_db0208374 [Orbilia brochopaga]|nr:hypothetical protein ABW21_db0208374 [Drechslerella brochopaga]
MANFTTIPIELKIKIFEYGDSSEDLASLFATCRVFRGVRESKYADDITRSVFKNETVANKTAELVALAKLRSLKSWRLSNSDKGALDRLAIDAPLSDLLEIRRTICWFTRKFFEHKLAESRHANQADISGPSREETSRVENAFCLLWMWIEAADDSTQGLGVSIQELLEEAFKGAQQDQKASPHSAIVLTVYHFLISQIKNLGPLYVETLEAEYVTSIAECCGCFTRYLRLGIPNLLMMRLGLDGLAKLLKEPISHQISAVKDVFDLVQQRTLDSHAWGDDSEALCRLYGLLDRYSAADSKLSRRPLWKSSGKVYNPNRMAWSQPDPLDYEAVLWDDQRLVRWGYHPAAKIDNSDLYLSGTASETFTSNSCTECQPEWECEDAPEDDPEVWKLYC